MALVAYSDNSDIGTDSEDGDETLHGKDQKTDKRPASIDPAKNASLTKPGAVDLIEDEEDFVKGKVSSSSLFSSVPAAVPVTNLFATEEEIEDEVIDVPTVETWKVTQQLKKRGTNEMGVSLPETEHTVTHIKDKKKIKIFIPSLSEFADDDDDDKDEKVKEPPRTKVNPSRSGSGLFSVLPEPKHASVKEAGRSLVPHILTKKPPQTKMLMRSVAKRPAAALDADGSVSDEEEVSVGTSDFFSLSEESESSYATAAPELVSRDVPCAIAPTFEPIREEPRVPCTQPEVPSLSLEQHHQHHAEVGPVAQDPSQPSAVAVRDIDEATILRLAGKRGRADVISFIDVNADDALLTRQEWMTKALSEEKPQHGFSRKREGLPTQKQKQKHQITYLAHQAKERELELKNTWAQNRMTKMQSQAKYGF